MTTTTISAISPTRGWVYDGEVRELTIDGHTPLDRSTEEHWMTRNDYNKARRLLRDNGRYALRWLPVEHVAVMVRVMFTKTRDPLAERAFLKDFERRLAQARAAR